LLTRQTIQITDNKGVYVSGISKIIKSIEPGEDETEIPLPKHKSKLGLQPLGDEPAAQSPPRRLDTTPLSTFEPPVANNPRWIFTIGATLIWLLSAAIIAFSLLRLGENWGVFTPMQWAGLVTMILGPLAIIWIANFAMRQLVRVSTQASHLQQMADRLSQPDLLVLGPAPSLNMSI